jgi:transposase-like protein
MNDNSGFDALFERLLRVTGAKTDSALARILNIKPQSVVAAKKRRQIPPAWVVSLAREYGVSTDWLFFGADAAGRGGDSGEAKMAGAGRGLSGAPDSPAGEIRMRTEEELLICSLKKKQADLEGCIQEQAERIRELERGLADAKDEALKAYRLAVEVMRPPVDIAQSRADAPQTPPLYLNVDSPEKL